MQEKQNNRGGRREGAGRPSRPRGRSVTFVTTPEVDAILDGLDGNKTRFLNEAVLFYHQHLSR